MYTAIKEVNERSDGFIEIKDAGGQCYALPLAEWLKFGQVISKMPKPKKAFKPKVQDITVNVKQRASNV